MACKIKVVLSSLMPILLFITINAGYSEKRPVPENGDSGYLLRYRLEEKQRWKYNIKMNHKFIRVLSGGREEIINDTNQKRYFSVDFTKKDANEHILTSVLLNDMSYNSQSQTGQLKIDFSNVKGKTFNMNMTALGREFEYSGLENLYVLVTETNQEDRPAGIKNIFNDIFLDLPEKPVKIGETWQANGSNTTFNGITRSKSTIEYNILCLLEGMEKRGNKDCLKIKITLEGTLAGDGYSQNRPFLMNGKIQSTTLAYFDHINGVLVDTASDTVTSGVMRISLGSQTQVGFPFKTIGKKEMILVQ